jgi:nitrite reductase (NO-forming)
MSPLSKVHFFLHYPFRDTRCWTSWPEQAAAAVREGSEVRRQATGTATGTARLHGLRRTREGFDMSHTSPAMPQQTHDPLSPAPSQPTPSRPDAIPTGDTSAPLIDPAQVTTRPSNRRTFLAQASALATFLAACTRSKPQHEHDDTTHVAKVGEHFNQNPDSRSDTTLRHAMPASSATPGTMSRNVAYHRFDPVLPPVASSRTTRLHFTAKEVPIRVREDTVVAAWTFEGDIPGPIVHVRQGDTIEFTLTNAGSIPHSMDFHAAQLDPKVAFRSVLPGQSLTFTYKPKYSGAFLYHCGTAPVLMHMGSGMFGAIIVDPLTPLRRAKEFVLVQNEFYLGPPQNGVAPFDYTKMLATLPDLFAFNGRPGQYQAAPIHVKRGDLVRFYVLNAGPTHPCAFHVVGEQFDTVYLGAPPGSAIHGVQTFDVAAGGGMIFEMQADIPGEFVFVNHAFGHGQKGAIGVLVVEE